MNPKFLLIATVATALPGAPALANGTPASRQPVSATASAAGVSIPDVAPVPLKKVSPSYPFDLRRMEVEGVVTLDLLVDTRGRVVGTELAGTTNAELTPLAVAAAREWTFLPASSEGRPVSCWVRVPFNFSISQMVAMTDR